MTALRLIKAALPIIERVTDELEYSYFNYGSDRIAPVKVRREVERNRKWIKQAQELLAK